MVKFLTSDFEAFWGESSGTQADRRARSSNVVGDAVLHRLLPTTGLDDCGEVRQYGLIFICVLPRKESGARRTRGGPNTVDLQLRERVCESVASHVHQEVVLPQKVRPQDGMLDISDDEHPPEASAEAQVQGQ